MTSRSSGTATLLWALLAPAVVACSSPRPLACTDDSQCSAQETCRAGACEVSTGGQGGAAGGDGGSIGSGGTGGGTADAGLDAGGVDAGRDDAGADGGAGDAGTADAGTQDAGHDAGLPDSGLDAGTPDSGSLDAGPDSGTLDAGPDAGTTDAGIDGGLVDAGACGDGVLKLDAGEECDDGNLLPGDQCDPMCQHPPLEDVFTLNQVVPGVLFDLAEYCDGMTTRHAVVQMSDAVDNSVRFRCGDVTGTAVANYGQEYCEYAAVQGGVRVTRAAQLDGGRVSCLFTSVFNDTPGLDVLHRQALSLAGNLDASVTDTSLVRLQRPVNSRGAANALIADCSNLSGDTNEARQVSCYEAYKAARAGGNMAAANQLRNLCRGQSLLDSAVFAQAQALGAVIPVEGDPGYHKHRELRGCVATQRAGGRFFSNADTTLCGRVFRARSECQCSFVPVPSTVVGFEFTTWLTVENATVPPECRPALVNGQNSKHLMICDVPARELPQVQASARYRDDLTGFCNDRFGKNLGLLVPLNALKTGCSTTTTFCGAFFD